MTVAEQRFGLTGPTVDPDAEPGGAAAGAAAPEGPYDAALNAAAQALDAGDLAGAVRAYKNVLADDPAHPEAKLGLAQAELLQRVQGMDPQKVRQGSRREAEGRRRADRRRRPGPGGRARRGRLRAADRHRAAHGGRRPGRRTARLLELFEVVGPEDPRVVGARRALARALF